MPRHRVDRQVAAGSDQVRTADVADEQRVTGQHAVRNVVVGMFIHHEADRLRRMSRGCQDLDRDLTQRQSLPVSKEVDRKPELGTDAIRDDRAGVRSELEMAADEVGVHVRLDNSLDRQALGRRLVEVHADIAPRIDDHGAAGRLVTDQVGGMRQTAEVVLSEDHRVPDGRGSGLMRVGHLPFWVYQRIASRDSLAVPPAAAEGITGLFGRCDDVGVRNSTKESNRPRSSVPRWWCAVRSDRPAGAALHSGPHRHRRAAGGLLSRATQLCCRRGALERESYVVDT